MTLDGGKPDLGGQDGVRQFGKPSFCQPSLKGTYPRIKSTSWAEVAQFRSLPNGRDIVFVRTDDLAFYTS